MKQDRQWLTPAQVAEELQLATDTVVRWAREGKIPARKLGREWRIHRDDLTLAFDAATPPGRRPA